MVPVEAGRFTGLQQSATRWPDSLKQAAALCTSLTLVGKGQVVGDVADKQALKAVEARFLVSVSFHAYSCVPFTRSHACSFARSFTCSPLAYIIVKFSN